MQGETQGRLVLLGSVPVGLVPLFSNELAKLVLLAVKTMAVVYRSDSSEGWGCKGQDL